MSKRRLFDTYRATNLHHINAVDQRAKREIDLIREYRTRLIADVVTGKVDVRHLAPPPEAMEAEAEAWRDLDDEMPEEDEAGFAHGNRCGRLI